MTNFFAVIVLVLWPTSQVVAQNFEALFQDFRASGLTREDKRFLQAALAFEGHYNGLLDGDWGRLSQSAFESYSWSTLGEPSEEWHMAFLAMSFFQLFDRDGWQIDYSEPMQMSMMVPSEAVTFDPVTDTFANFHHTQSTLAYSIGVLDLETAQSMHGFTFDWHEVATEPYSVRKDNLAVTTGTRRDGSVLYTRSNYINGGWSTVMLSADRVDVPILNAVAASLSVGRSDPLSFTIGGRIDVAVTQTLDILSKEDEARPQASQNRDQFIQVSSHATLNDAIEAAQTYQSRFPEVQVFETETGFFAVVVEIATLERVNSIIEDLVADRAVPIDTYATAGARFTQRVWTASVGATGTRVESPPPQPSEPPKVSGSGTGFFVSANGHVLTNEHVVRECSGLTVNDDRADLIAVSADFDLALLKVDGIETEGIAAFSPSPARLNSDVTVVGFPLSQLLSGLNVTRGAVSAQMGFRGDATRMQITAPVQSGNSGGPVLGSDGNVVGVVVSKLDAAIVANDFGDTPQNVNFAIRGEIAKLFLAQNDVDPILGESDGRLPPEDLAASAKLFTVFIECNR